MFNKIKYFIFNPLQIPIVLLTKFLPYFRFIYETQDYQCRINFELWFKQKILDLGGNKDVYWPVHYTSTVHNPDRILTGIDTCPGLSKGCYIQGIGGLIVGDYTQIGPNVVIVTANHDLYNSRKSILSAVTIGRYCWLGAGAKIMPGVVLGDWTIVGAGAVVTTSFTEGYCVIGGVPAKKIKDLDIEKCVPFENKIKYRGYIAEHKFDAYRNKYLKI